MPNKIPLSEILKKLPPFLRLHEETYLGTRYKAKFTDLDYKEEFEAVVCSVINLQYGCPSRSDDKRRESGWKKGCGSSIPISEVKAKLPEYLEIDESTYKGVRYKARFYDTEYKVYFEMYVRNVLRTGKGYCEQRAKDEFLKAVTLTPEELQLMVSEIYGDEIRLIKETYVNRYTACDWLRKGNLIHTTADHILSEKMFHYHEINAWKKTVKERDGYKCKKCNNPEKLHTHHILTWKRFPAHRFDLDNGITLCKDCHENYHAIYKNEETKENFILWMADGAPQTNL